VDKKRKAQSRLWCAFCGKWGNHQSGAHAATKPDAKQVKDALGMVVKDFRLSESFDFGAGAYDVEQDGEDYHITVIKRRGKMGKGMPSR